MTTVTQLIARAPALPPLLMAAARGLEHGLLGWTIELAGEPIGSGGVDDGGAMETEMVRLQAERPNLSDLQTAASALAADLAAADRPYQAVAAQKVAAALHIRRRMLDRDDAIEEAYEWSCVVTEAELAIHHPPRADASVAA